MGSVRLSMKRAVLAPFMSAMLLSNIGRTAYFVSLTWIVLTRTDNVRQVAALLLVGAVAQFFSSGISGYLADLIDRRRLSMGFDVVRALISLATGIAITTTADIWPLFLSIALFSMADRGYLTSMQSIVPSLVAPKCAVRVNAASYMMMQSGSFMGALLAGAFLHQLPHNALYTATATIFLVSATAIGRLRLPHARSGAAGGVSRFRLEHILALRHLTDNRLVFPAFYYSLSFSVGVLMNVVMSSYVANDLKGDAALFGRTESAWALGSAMVCVFLLVRFATGVPKCELVTPLFVSGLMLVSLGLIPDPRLTLIAALILGASCNLGRVFIDARVQQTVDVGSTGRARGAIHMLSTGAGLAVYASIALFGDALSASILFTAFGLLVVFAAGGGMFLQNSLAASGADCRRQKP
ncbi:MFS transporter [Brucella intermedia]|uniref:MFS transporter n=1 Tax=Brucella intermedia TaxID=94625 RepID=UPI002361919F|nr:MFS transporter [Brucella intermedia]